MTPAARVVQNMMACVLHANRKLLAEGRHPRQNDVERPVFASILLNIAKVLSLGIHHSRDAQVRQRSKFQNSFSGDQRLKLDGCATEAIPALGDDGLNLVALCGKQTPVLLPELRGGAVAVLGFRVRQNTRRRRPFPSLWV